jgi:hypothetical protein
MWPRRALEQHHHTVSCDRQHQEQNRVTPIGAAYVLRLEQSCAQYRLPFDVQHFLPAVVQQLLPAVVCAVPYAAPANFLHII